MAAYMHPGVFYQSILSREVLKTLKVGGHGISLFLPWKRIQHSTFIHKITKLRIQHNTFIHKITKLRLLRQVDNVALSKLALVAFSLKGTRTQHTEILRDSAPTRQLESRAQ